nr:hypothetical protein [Pandoravirus massiliensis]
MHSSRCCFFLARFRPVSVVSIFRAGASAQTTKRAPSQARKKTSVRWPRQWSDECHLYFFFFCCILAYPLVNRDHPSKGTGQRARDAHGQGEATDGADDQETDGHEGGRAACEKSRPEHDP